MGACLAAGPVREGGCKILESTNSTLVAVADMHTAEPMVTRLNKEDL